MMLPPPGYTRRQPISDTELVVQLVDGTGEVIGPFDFGSAPPMGSVREELAIGFVVCASPDGPWQARSSARSGYKAAVAFVRSLERLGIKLRTLSDLTPEHWWTWRADYESRNRWPAQINLMRVLLRNVSCVPQLTLRAVSQRASKPRRRLYTTYSPAEFERLRAHAAAHVRAADSRIRRCTKLLEAHRLGQEVGDGVVVRAERRDWTVGELLERLFDHGRLSFTYHYLSPHQQAAAALGTGDLDASYALFPTRMEILSLMVLLVCDRGYNLSTLESLAVPDSAGPDEHGKDVLIAHLDKPRLQSNRHFTHSYAGRSATILRLGMSMTATARASAAAMGHSIDRLLLAGSSSGVTDHPTRVFSDRGHTLGGIVALWSEQAAIPSDDGDKLRLNFRRLRLTEQVVNRKSSQNSDNVSEDIYRRPEALTAAMVSDVILEGQAEAVAHAHATVTMRYTTEPAQLGLPRSIADDLSHGRLDTGVGACLDDRHSPFDAPGEPCTASFLLCLACPNAVATPAHLPRLVELSAALDNVASVNPNRFQALYATHRARLAHLLTTSTTPAQQRQARQQVSDTDRDLIERLLRRELDA